MSSKPEGNIFLFSGSDEQRAGAEAQKVFTAFAGEPPDTFSSDILNEGDGGATPDLVLDAVRSLKSPSMLGGVKTVWLRHFSGFDSESEKKDRKGLNDMALALRELSDFLGGGLAPDMVLVMDGPGISVKGPLYQACKAFGKVMILDRVERKSRDWDRQMASILQAAAKEKGLALQPQAVDYLVDALGTDSGRIDAELEKIICYRGTVEGEATLEEVQAVCVGKGEEMSWALADILGGRNITETLRIIDVLITQNKEDEGIARGMLLSCAGFFRTAIRIRTFMAENRLKTPVALKSFVAGMGAEQKAKAAAEGFDMLLYHPFRLQNMAAGAERYTPQELIHAIRVFRDAIWQITSSGTSARVALESALLEVIGAGRRRL